MRVSAELETSAGRWPAQLVDLSFSGAMIACNMPVPPSRAETITLYINANQPNAINMRGHLVHLHGNYMGIECSPTGVDHRSRLRKIFNPSESGSLG